MRRSWEERVQDILEAIEAAQSFTKGMSLATFQTDFKAIGAVAYQIIILGEASNHIPPEIQAANPQVPWHKMRAIRNVAIHEYFRFDIPTLWRTVEKELPTLVEPLRVLLEQNKNEGQA